MRIRGMMPTFNVWQEAQQTLAAGRAAVEFARAATPVSPARGRLWPWIAVAVAMLAIALTVQRAEGPDAIPMNASTPVNKMPWRRVKDPGGSFQVSLPAKPSSQTVVSIAGSGRQLRGPDPANDHRDPDVRSQQSEPGPRDGRPDDP